MAERIFVIEDLVISGITTFFIKPFTLKNGGWPTIRCSSDAPSATAFFKKLLMEISSVIFFAFISFL